MEQAVPLADRVRSVRFRAWFRTMLGEAYLASGELDKATAVVSEALETSSGMQFAVGAGLSRQVLGRIAQAQGNLAQAEQHLNDAVTLLTAVGALFDLARTKLALAKLKSDLGDKNASASQLREARILFDEVRNPRDFASERCHLLADIVEKLHKCGATGIVGSFEAMRPTLLRGVGALPGRSSWRACEGSGR